jgi:hypothetical protein
VEQKERKMKQGLVYAIFDTDISSSAKKDITHTLSPEKRKTKK